MQSRGSLSPRTAVASLASRLMQVLQAAIQQEWQDEKLANKLFEKLKPWASPNEQRAKDPPPQDTGSKGPGGKGAAAVKGKGKRGATSSGTSLAKEAAEEKSSTRAKIDTVRPPPDKGGPISLNASEWTKPVKLVSKAAVLAAVEQGSDVEGNVTVVKSEGEARELKALWTAATRYDPLTILLLVADCKSLGGSCAKVSLKRGAGPFAVQDATIVVLGDTHAAPWARQAKFSPPPKTTIRISAPFHYRLLFRNDDQWDSVSDVLAEIGKWKVCQVSQLTGGTWKWSSTKEGHQLVGHLRVPRALAEALLHRSGEKAIMITLTQVGDRPDESIRWFPKGDQDDETYFRAAVAAAASKGQGLKYRVGKGSDVGILRSAGEDAPEPRALVVQAQGIPKAWEGSEITSFFSSQGWKEVVCVTSKWPDKKAKKGVQWTLKGFPPVGGGDTENVTVWQYCDQDDPKLHIHVTKAPPRKPKVSDEFSGKGPPKKFFLKNETSEQAKPKVIDLEDMEVEEGHEDPEGDEKEAAKVPATPCVEDVPVVPEANEIAQARREGWTEVDLKGNGDCTFRCIAAAREFFDSEKVLSQTESKNKGALVRVDAVSHMRRHLERYLPNFAVDRDIPPEAPALDPATIKGNFEKWLQQLECPQAWADGLVLLACAVRYGQPIIVWYFHTEGNHWKRVTIAPDFHAGFARIAKKTQPITLLLKNEHFTWFKPPAGLDVKIVKRSWMRESAIPDRKVLQGAAPKSSGTPSLHSLESELCSPAKKSVAKDTGSSIPSVHALSCAGCVASCKGGKTPSLHSLQSSFSLCASFNAKAACCRDATGSSHVCGPKKGHVNEDPGKSPQAGEAVKGTEVCSGTPSLHDLDEGARTPSLCNLSQAFLVGTPGCVGPRHKEHVFEFSGRAVAGDTEADREALKAALLRKRKEPETEHYSETIAGDLDQLLPKRLRLFGKQKPSGEDPEPPPKKFEHVCSVCSALLSCASSASLSASTKHHYSSKRPEVPLRLIFPSKKVIPATLSHDIPKASRTWECPVCHKGLPAMSDYERICAIAKHCKDEHPKETPSTLHHKRLKGLAKPESMKANLAKHHARVREEKEHKDDHVRVVLPKPNWSNDRGCWVYCRYCLAHLQRRSPEFLKVPCKERLSKTSADLTAKRMKMAWWSRLCKEDPAHKELLLQATGWTEEAVNKLLS